MQVNVFINF